MTTSTTADAHTGLITMFRDLADERENDVRSDDIVNGLANPVDIRIMATPARTLAEVLAKARLCHRLAVENDDFNKRASLDDWTVLRSILADLQRVPLNDSVALRAVFAALTGGEDPKTNPVMEREGERQHWQREHMTIATLPSRR
jgi:hypothetical protein